MRVIVGLGNPFRGDDGVGPRVLELLRELYAIPGTRLTDDLSGLLDVLDEHSEVVLIDAVRGSGEPGTIYDWDFPPAGELRRLSSHGLDLEQVLSLARVLGRTPRRLTVFGVLGANFQPGTGLTPAVEQAARQLAARLAV